MIPVKEERTEEQAARRSPVCAGCNEKKQLGLLVCWPCWKAPEDSRMVALKYFDDDFVDWLQLYAKR